MPNDRLTKHIFNVEYNTAIDLDNWTNKVKSIFTMLEMNDTFNERNLCDLNGCKEKLWKIAVKEWKFQVDSKPKLRTFIKFKKNLDNQ